MIQDEKDFISKQYNYLRKMAGKCTLDVFQSWEKYLTPLSEKTFYWEQIMMADPASPTKFISNLIELFEKRIDIESRRLNPVHFKIAVAAAAVFSVESTRVQLGVRYGTSTGQKITVRVQSRLYFFFDFFLYRKFLIEFLIEIF